MQVSAVRRYPVKSFRGEDVDAAAVEPWGLAGDRRWMVVDADGCFRTSRESPRMLLATPSITVTGLRVTGPDLPPLEVAAPTTGPRTTVEVWSSRVPATDAGDEAAAWVGELVGESSRLVHLADPTVRATDPTYSRPEDRVSFADGYPLHLTTEASLAALDDALLEGSGGYEQPLPMTRFRPNVVVRGAEAWAEDDWRRVRLGDTVFRVVKGCARCVLTTKHPETAEGGREPLATLARIRRYDGQTWFGVNLVPDDVDPATPPLLRSGDGVEVLESVEPGEGPPR